MNITVNEENRPPTGLNANIQVLENNQNHSISHPLPSDPDGDPVTIRVVSLPDPAKGVVTLDDGTPVTVGQVLSNTDFSGLEFDTVSGQTGAAGQFVYSLDDGNNPLENRNFNFDIRPRNDPPVAQNDFYATNEDTTLNVPVNGVLGNDSDPDGPNPLSAQLVLGPANGNLTLNANGSFSYTPNANFFGNDSFTYRASDGSLNSSNATVSITVNARNDPPVAVNDLATTALNTAIAINVRANDTDIEDGVPGGSPLIVSGPSNGSVTINPTGNVVYTPDLGYTGTDSFTYRAVDSNGASSSNVATVSLNVTAVSNDLPVAPGGSLNVVEDSQNNNIGLAAPSDPDGDALTITVFSLPDPVKGDVTLSNGTPLTVGQTLSIAQLQSLQYDAALNATGAAGNFVYSVSDGVNPAVNGSVSFNISPVNDAPRLSFGDNESFGFAEQSTLFGDNYVPNNVLPSSYRPGVQTLEMETAGIVMQESRNVSVTFVSETSAEAGSLGWYIIDQATGEIQNPQIIWNSMDSGFLGGGTTVNLGNLNEGDQIGFFVVNDGFNQNNFDNPAGANYIDLANGSLFFGTAPGGAAATIYSSAPALWYVPTGNPGGAFQLNTSANGIYHTEAYQGLGNLSLNPDSHAHSKGEAYHSGGQFLIGIEAATNPTSNNTTFNDYVFRVNLGQETTQEIANHGNYDFEINDVDSDQLQRATFVIRNTPHAVNDKIGMTGYDVSGGGSSGSIAGTTLFISGLGTRSVTITGTEDIEVYESVLSSLRIFRSGRTQHPEPFAPGGAFPYVYRPGARELEVSVTDTNGAVSNILGPNNESDPFNDISANVNASWAVRSLGTGNNVESTGNSWTLLGNNGNDTLTGNGGFINIDGGQGNDVITGTNGAQDTLIGSAGNDTINGRGGDDIILGGIGIDIINGGSGDDYISGGQGTDEITLGSGSDYVVFMFDDVGNGVDIIFDFNVSDDVIDLSDVLDYEGGNLDFWVHAERNGAVTEISVDVDGPLNGANFVPIAVITNFLPVGSSINIDYGGGVAPIEVV